VEVDVLETIAKGTVVLVLPAVEMVVVVSVA